MENDEGLSSSVPLAWRCAPAGTSGEEAFGLEQSGGGWGGQNQKSIDSGNDPEIS